jgi:hypothetical protein
MKKSKSGLLIEDGIMNATAVKRAFNAPGIDGKSCERPFKYFKYLNRMILKVPVPARPS